VNIDPNSSHLQLAIADAHLEVGDFRLAMDAAAYAVTASGASAGRRDSVYVLWRACALQIRELVSNQDWAKVAEDMEFALLSCADIHDDEFVTATLDLMLWVQDSSMAGALESSDNFIAKRIVGLVGQIRAKREDADSAHVDRRVGYVESLAADRGFGFLRSGESRFFFHARSLWDRRQFDDLVLNSVLVFTPGALPASGNPEASSVDWVG
ncbi:hypothetical protein, partial [Rhodococcus sp. NPDC058514]|uniref:hypothetical protein n=1 Tax=Rhodococcus sp. NPDC058514 TaxID=3346532 RepID=UPI003664CA1C